MLLTEIAAIILKSVLMDFLLFTNADQTSLFLRNLRGADGRIASKFQLRTQPDLLHVMQLPPDQKPENIARASALLENALEQLLALVERVASEIGLFLANIGKNAFHRLIRDAVGQAVARKIGPAQPGYRRERAESFDLLICPQFQKRLFYQRADFNRQFFDVRRR